jgi:hypothetical protein
VANAGIGRMICLVTVNLRGGGDVVLLLFSMADSKFILYVRKFLKNPLLARKQVVSTKSLNLSVN